MDKSLHLDEQSLETFTEYLPIPATQQSQKINTMERTFGSVSNHLSAMTREICRTDQRQGKYERSSKDRIYSRPEIGGLTTGRNEFLENQAQNLFDLTKANHNHIRVYRTMNNLYKKSRISMPLRRLQSVFTQKNLKDNRNTEKQSIHTQVQKQINDGQENRASNNLQIQQNITQQQEKNNPKRTSIYKKVFTEEIQEEIIVQQEINKVDQISSSSKKEWMKAQNIIRNLQALIN